MGKKEEITWFKWLSTLDQRPYMFSSVSFMASLTMVQKQMRTCWKDECSDFFGECSKSDEYESEIAEGITRLAGRSLQPS